LLKWDEAIEDIKEDETANIPYKESPYEQPRYCIWIWRDKYPSLVVKNITNRPVRPQIIWIAAKFSFEEVVDPDVLDKLRRGLIRSYPIAIGKVV